MQDLEVESIIDLGCGPGNSTAILKKYFKHAHITGLDYSSNMIQKAKENYPDLNFVQGNVQDFSGSYDLIFSNACLQWVDHHETLIPYLINHLNKGGTLAVQIPINHEEPLYQIIKEVANNPKWHFDQLKSHAYDISSKFYYTLLSTYTNEFDMWETIYYHPLPSHQALLDWIKGTSIRPYLDALPLDEQKQFQTEILAKQKSYILSKKMVKYYYDLEDYSL